MKDFDINHTMNEFKNLSGRVPDYNNEKYRAMFWRFDEACRRGEDYIKKQGFFFLPTLDYGIFKGVPPLFSGKQMRLHYSVHHRAYVDRLNKLIVGSRYYGMPLDELIKASVGDPDAIAIYNNAAQHYNHCFFWKSMQPWGCVMPPDLEAKIVEQYGSVDNLKDAMKQAAVSFFGSGWLFWVYDESIRRFDIITLPNAGCPLTMQGITPLITLDLWEHTYYVDYENERAKYVDKFWRVTDWHWAERHWKRATGQHYDPMIWV